MPARLQADAADNDGSVARPNLAAVFLTLAAAIATIVIAMWLIRWFVYPMVPAGPYTIIGLVVVGPTLAIALRPRPAPGWMVKGCFGGYITAVTVGIHYGGGVDNVSGPLLYALVIGLAGLTASERAAYLVAAGSL